jgi:hypothetical protein
MTNPIVKKTRKDKTDKSFAPRDPQTKKFKTKGETQATIDAFEYYYALDTERTYSKVAKQFGTSVTTISYWSTKFKWKERIEKRNGKVEEKLEEIAVEAIVKAKVRYRQALAEELKDFTRYVKDMKKWHQDRMDEWNNLSAKEKKEKHPPKPWAFIREPADLERMVKLDLLLGGEATSIGEQRGASDIPPPRDRRTEIAELIRSNPQVREILTEAWCRMRIATLPVPKELEIVDGGTKPIDEQQSE